MGYINNGLTTSYEQLVVSNEVMGMIRRITQGFKINKDTMALDLIDEIGPGGEFLTSEHTLKHFRQNWIPELISRNPYEKWEQEGKKNLATKANESAKRILENHTPRTLDEKIKKELREMVKTKEKA